MQRFVSLYFLKRSMTQSLLAIFYRCIYMQAKSKRDEKNKQQSSFVNCSMGNGFIRQRTSNKPSAMNFAQNRNLQKTKMCI